MRDIDKDEFVLFPWWMIVVGVVLLGSVLTWAFISMGA